MSVYIGNIDRGQPPKKAFGAEADLIEEQLRLELGDDYEDDSDDVPDDDQV